MEHVGAKNLQMRVSLSSVPSFLMNKLWLWLDRTLLVTFLEIANVAGSVAFSSSLIVHGCSNPSISVNQVDHLKSFTDSTWNLSIFPVIIPFQNGFHYPFPPETVGCPTWSYNLRERLDSAVPYSMPQHLWCPGWCSIPCSCRCGSSHFHCGLVQCTFEGALVTEKRRLDGPWWLLGEATWWICWIPMFQQFANDRNIQADMGGSNICNLLIFKQNIRWLLPNLLMIQHNRFTTLPFYLNRPVGFQTPNVRFCFTPTVISHKYSGHFDNRFRWTT